MTKLDAARDAFVDEAIRTSDAKAYDEGHATREAHGLESAARKMQAAIEEFAEVLKASTYAHDQTSFAPKWPKPWAQASLDATEASIDAFAWGLSDQASSLLREAIQPQPAKPSFLQVAKEVVS